MSTIPYKQSSNNPQTKFGQLVGVKPPVSTYSNRFISIINPLPPIPDEFIRIRTNDVR